MMDEKETARDGPEPKKRRGGHKPFTPERKAAAAKAREEVKRKADSMTPEVVIQYQDSETNVTALIESAKAGFRFVKKRTLITDIKLYVKPEERAVYYVANESFDGKISF